MTPDAFFQVANPVALLGWLALLFSPCLAALRAGRPVPDPLPASAP